MGINYNEFGLIIDKKIYNLLEFYKLKGFKKELIRLIDESIGEIGDSYILLKNGNGIESIMKTRYKRGMKKIDYDSNGLRIRNMLFYLSHITNFYEELRLKLIKLIQDSIKDLNYGIIILTDNQEIKPTALNIYDLVKKKLCYHSLAYCCGLKLPETNIPRPCANRDRVLRVLEISNEEYTKMKEEFGKKFDELAFKKKPEFF